MYCQEFLSFGKDEVESVKKPKYSQKTHNNLMISELSLIVKFHSLWLFDWLYMCVCVDCRRQWAAARSGVEDPADGEAPPAAPQGPPPVTGGGVRAGARPWRVPWARGGGPGVGGHQHAWRQLPAEAGGLSTTLHRGHTHQEGRVKPCLSKIQLSGNSAVFFGKKKLFS